MADKIFFDKQDESPAAKYERCGGHYGGIEPCFTGDLPEGAPKLSDSGSVPPDLAQALRRQIGDLELPEGAVYKRE